MVSHQKKKKIVRIWYELLKILVSSVNRTIVWKILKWFFITSEQGKQNNPNEQDLSKIRTMPYYLMQIHRSCCHIQTPENQRIKEGEYTTKHNRTRQLSVKQLNCFSVTS